MFQDFLSFTYAHKTLCILIHHFHLLHFYPFRAWLVREFLFLFLFSKQYKNNFLKIELETSFQIIIFIFYGFGSYF